MEGVEAYLQERGLHLESTVHVEPLYLHVCTIILKDEFQLAGIIGAFFLKAGNINGPYLGANIGFKTQTGDLTGLSFYSRRTFTGISIRDLELTESPCPVL